MSLRKRPSKKAKKGYTWEVYFNYKQNGITRRYSKSGFETKPMAQDHETEMKKQLLDTGIIKKINVKTFSDVYIEFLELGSDQFQENSMNQTKSKYNKYLKNSIGNILISKFDYPMLQKFFNSLSSNGIATNRIIKVTINRILNYALKVGYITYNPISLVTVKGIDTSRKEDKIISYDDIYTIIDDLKASGSFRYKAYAIAIEIGCYTGLRISEAFALEKNDIDFDNNLINVNKKLVYNALPKNELYTTHQMKSAKSEAVIPLADPLKKSLIEWFKINPYQEIVCDEENYYIHPTIFTQYVKRVAAGYGINFYFHKLRHTFATILVTNDVDLKTAQELMRHSNINTTMSIYTHINDGHKKQVIDTIFNTESVEKVSKVN